MTFCFAVYSQFYNGNFRKVFLIFLTIGTNAFKSCCRSFFIKKVEWRHVTWWEIKKTFSTFFYRSTRYCCENSNSIFFSHDENRFELWFQDDSCIMCAYAPKKHSEFHVWKYHFLSRLSSSHYHPVVGMMENNEQQYKKSVNVNVNCRCCQRAQLAWE